MPARSISTATISFGLVSVPVSLYSSAESKASISFNMLHKKCSGRLKQQYICPKCDVIVPREEMAKGYEFTKSQYVLFSDDVVDRMHGSAALLERMCHRLWVEPGKMSEDGLVSVGRTSCTGMCDQGPALLVNGRAVPALGGGAAAGLRPVAPPRGPLQGWSAAPSAPWLASPPCLLLSTSARR